MRRPEEYARLKAELEAKPYEYRFKVYQRMQPWHRQELIETMRRIRVA